MRAEGTTNKELSPREMQVLPLLAEGLSNKLIAGRMEISESAAKFHVMNIMGKLGATTRTQAVTSALRRNLLNLTPERALRPMSEAPTTGPVKDILVATTNRAGCKGWLIAHYADGGGEEQPRFQGWFYWTGHGFDQVPTDSLIGWVPLPDLPMACTSGRI